MRFFTAVTAIRLIALTLMLVLVKANAASTGHQHGGGESLLQECQDSAALPSVNCGRVPTPAFDRGGRLWVAFVQNGHVYVAGPADPGQGFSAPRAVNPVPERIYNDGENRPKIAIGDSGEVYVSWTEKTEGRFAGDIRFSRSLDGGMTFSEPVRVNDDRAPITHRFDSMVLDGKGRIFITWIDKRDLVAAKRADKPYAGAAIYYAVSSNRGDSFSPDRKLADHSCECCRIALDIDAHGQPVALWRHVYPVNLRDHAIARLTDTELPIEGVPPRATDDGWIIEGCPHHGPDLSIDGQDKAHMTWFTQGEKNKGLIYGRYDLSTQQLEFQYPIDSEAGASRPQVASLGNGRLFVAWKRFSGVSTELLVRESVDDGQNWSQPKVLATTNDGSDHPIIITNGGSLYVSWHTLAEGYMLIQVI